MPSIHKIRIGSRRSSLAQVQIKEILQLMHGENLVIDPQLILYSTQGDQDKTSSLADHAVDNFFTDALDEALLKHEVDVTIHSAKDLPKQLHPDLEIIAFTESPDSTDAFVGRVAFTKLPSGACVGTSSWLRQASVKELNPHIQTVDIRGTIEERIKQFEEGKYDGIIVATVALKRLGLEKYITEIMPWDGIALQGQLAVVARRDNAEMKELFSAIDVRRKYGTVYLVGAGPGDPDLITLKAIKLLEKADYVFYDYLAHKDILKHAKKAEKIYVGKKKGEHSVLQHQLSKLLKEHAFQGKMIVRLKGGDPLVFGRGAEEIAYLHDYHIPYEIIPGVSSATGIASGLGIPLTARDISSSVAFVSGYSKEEEAHEPQDIHIPDADTLVFLMGLSKLPQIVQTLLTKGWPPFTPVAVISRGTFIDEKIVVGKIEDIIKVVEASGLVAPALIIVGQTVEFWRERSKGRRSILYTGTNPEKYQALGKIIHFPMIDIKPAQVSREVAECVIAELPSYEMILLTSQFGVRYFFELLNKYHYSTGVLSSKKFLVIGRHTADALAQFGFSPALIANIETSEGMLKDIVEHFDVKGKSILFPRSALPNPYLKVELTKLGAKVDEVVIYENIKHPKQSLPKEKIDTVFFTSPSTVKNFLENYGSIPKAWSILSKGEITSHYLKEQGYESEVMVNG